MILCKCKNCNGKGYVEVKEDKKGVANKLMVTLRYPIVYLGGTTNGNISRGRRRRRANFRYL